MRVVYRNHIELIRKNQLKRQALQVLQMLERGEGDKNGFLERTN